jgi:hypothetical protein
MAFDTGTAALTPTVVSSISRATRMTSTPPIATEAQDDVSTHATAGPLAPLPATAPRQAGANPADEVFEPQVRGPGDPPINAAKPAARAAATPYTDTADLRVEQSDASFVF